MKMLLKAGMLAATAVTLPVIASAPAMAQAAQSVGIVNIEQAVQTSNAYKTAIQQMRTTYKTNIDQFQSRSAALNTELKPLIDKFNTAQQAASPDRNALQTQYEAIQTRQNAAKQELARINEPVARANAYVEEQIANKLDAAIKAAMTQRKVSIVLDPRAVVSYQPSVDLTNDVVAQLNQTVPSVSITPPAGWQPGGQGQQQPQAAAAPAATTQQNPAQQPQSR